MAAVVTKLGEEGYKTTVRSVRIQGHTIVRMHPCIGSQVQMEFPSVSPARMCEMPTAARLDVRPMLAKAPRMSAKVTPAALREYAQSRTQGCMVLCSDPGDAVQIVKDVIRRVFARKTGA